MKTLDNINKIINDLQEKENSQNTYYINVSNRLDKVLKNYLNDLELNYNTIINNNDLSSIIKELIK